MNLLEINARIRQHPPFQMIERVTALETDGGSVVYEPLAADCELSGKADCSEALRAAWRERNPSEQERVELLETLVAELLYGGEGE